MIYVRLLFIILWLFLCCIIELFLSLFRWGDLNLNRDFAKLFGWGVLKIARVQLEVKGLEHLEAHQPCIYVGNHQSGFDMATFGSIFPAKTLVIGKKELQWIPLFGLFFAAAGNIMIKRQDRRKAIGGLNQALEAIRLRKVSVWIFPEGTRNKTGIGLLPFKKGAFYMAIQAGIPIVPILSSSLLPLMSWKEKRMSPGKIRLHILPPIFVSGYTLDQVDLLSQQVREKMLEALRGLSSHQI